MARKHDDTRRPGIYLRLLGTWGLSLAGLPCSLAEEAPRRCPLRPLAEELKRRAMRGAPRTGHGPG